VDNSSAQPEYLITSSDTISYTGLTQSQLDVLQNITITSSGSSSYTTGAMGSGVTFSTASISQLNINDIIIKWPEDWVDKFPEWDRIQKMCDEYPGLKIAFEKFKTTYHLVKDHYDTPEDQRPRT
jgi:hypothetical protein